MARRRNRNGDDRRLRSESSRSESSQMESNTSDADSETDISISESFPVRFRKRHSGCSPISPIGRGQKQSSSPSSGSEDDGGSRYRHKRQKRKSRPGNWMEEGTLVQELNDWRRKDSSSCDSIEGDTTTDPDIESGKTSSDSEDDGYAEGTKRQIALMGDRWARFCRKQQRKLQLSSDSRWEDPHIALRAAGKSELTSFLRWCCKLKRGKNRRMLKGIRKASALDTNWKMFLRYYEKVNTHRMSDELGRRMRKSIRKIIKDKELITDEKEKPPMYIEDVVILQETVIRTMEKRFHIGLQRIQQCLYNLMACFTVNRINAMRKLQYKHLQCSIQRDPEGGPPRILLEVTYKFAKTHLGVTQGNTFVIPEIIDDPSLMLSPHEFLLGILFDDDAFLAPGIQSRDDLRRLWLEDSRQQLPLPLKGEKENHYVFCKVEAVRGSIRVIRDQPISTTVLSNQYRTFGEIAGFPNLYTHCNRYGGGTILNQSSKFALSLNFQLFKKGEKTEQLNIGLVSDAQQNLIMKHASIRTFLNHYLPRRIGTDMQSLMRGLKPDSAMMRAVTRMGRWIDTRRPRELTGDQKASVETAPELREAINKRDAFVRDLRCSGRMSRKELVRVEQLKRDVTNTRSRLLYDLRKRVREEFDKTQAVKDIQRQLTAGTAIHDDKTREILRARENMLPQQIILLEKLMTWPTSSSLEREWSRRNEAVEAVRMYCGVREGGPRRGRRPKRPIIAESVAINDTATLGSTQPVLPPPRDETLQKAKAHIEMATKPLGCFQCYGNIGESDERRLKHYSRHKHLLRHFRATHLDERHCNFCNETVEHEMALRRHAHDKHGLKT